MKTTSFLIFIFILCFAPLAFGSVEPWSQSILQFLIPLALGCLLLAKDGRETWREIPGLTPLLALLAFMGMQLVPLPIPIIKLISPATLAIYQPIIDLPGGPQFIPITINTKATFNELCRFTTYAFFYILTIQLTSSYKLLRRTLYVILSLAGCIAFFAIIQKFTSPDKIYWFRQAPLTSNPVGPWVYRNHYAGFMEMLIPFGLAMFLKYRPRFKYSLSLREKIFSVLTLPTANRHILFGFASFVMATSVIVSLSRGGIISTTLSILCFLLILNRKRQIGGNTLPILFCIIGVILLSSWIGWEPVIERFNRMTNADNAFFDGRFLIWQDTLPIIKDYWLLGSGFGTFIHIFPLYRNALQPGTIIDHAHNDYIELITSGGIIGVLLVGWFLAVLILQATRQLQRRRDPGAKLLGYAALCSMLALAFHSVTDFNMYNYANGLYFFCICGLLITSCHTRNITSSQSSFLPSRPAPRFTLGIPVICIGLALLILNQGKAAAYQSYSKIKTIYLNSSIPKETVVGLNEFMLRAHQRDQFSATYPFVLANINEFIPNRQLASQYYIEAVYRNPTKAPYLLQAGRYFGQTNQTAEYELLKAAGRADQTSSWVNRQLAAWYLKRGDKERGINYLKQGLILERKANRFNQYIAIALTSGISLVEFEEILPQKTKSYIQMGSFLAKEKDVEAATFYYREGMKYLDADDLQAWYFTSPFRFFTKHKQFDNALAIARTAVEYMPENVKILLMAGSIYAKQDLGHKAQEYYQQVLLIDPKNKRATQELRRLKKKNMEI